MKKSVAMVMGIVISAALLLGGCASNTKDETKAGSTAETKRTESINTESTDKETQKNTEVPSSGQSDTEKTGSDQTGSNPDGQQTSDPRETEQASEAQDSETSAEGAEFTPGTYVGDGESITITEADGALTFSFTQAGIAGTATIDGDTAVYSGDDGHQIEFRQDDTILTVTVTGEQGEESDSPLAGTYVKEAD